MGVDAVKKQDEDVVATAEKIVDSLRRKNNKNNKDNNEPELTRSQIRKFLSAVNKIENKLLILESKQGKKLEVLPDELKAEIKMLKAKLVYQAGRDDKGIVKDFLNKSKMLERIDEIGDNPQKFKQFARLVEAIVAYHRYRGGKD